MAADKSIAVPAGPQAVSATARPPGSPRGDEVLRPDECPDRGESVGAALTPGQADALGGRNGAGKSMLLKTFAGLHGEHLGRDAHRRSAHELGRGPGGRTSGGVGMALQGEASSRDSTLAENLALGQTQAPPRPEPVLQGIPPRRAPPAVRRAHRRAAGRKAQRPDAGPRSGSTEPARCDLHEAARCRWSTRSTASLDAHRGSRRLLRRAPRPDRGRHVVVDALDHLEAAPSSRRQGDGRLRAWAMRWAASPSASWTRRGWP